MIQIKTFHSRYLGISYSNLYLGSLILTMSYQFEAQLKRGGFKIFKCLQSTPYINMRRFTHPSTKTMTNLTVFNSYIY